MKSEPKSQLKGNNKPSTIITKYERLKSNEHLNKRVFQFKVELEEILPSIWRRILVPSTYNFWDLHVAIQDAMGWSDYHLHHFQIRGKHKRQDTFLGIPSDSEVENWPTIIPGWEVPIALFFNELGTTAKYCYDYGDSWWHTVTLEGYLFRDKSEKYPQCIAGEQACPPEDCGGVSGYFSLIEILSNPEHEQFKDLKTWVGETWNSDYFSQYSVEFDDPLKRWRNAFLKK